MTSKLIFFIFVILCLGCDRSEPALKIEGVKAKKRNEQTHISPIAITSGQASISCDYDYEKRSDIKIPLLTNQLIDSIIQGCVEDNMIHLYYSGEINSEFTALVYSVSASARRAGISIKILDINSSGGDVDAAMKAGDIISENNWGIWVTSESSCMSACVLVLASGNQRSISGPVGIHRLFPKDSDALNLNDLDNELEAITEKVRSYLRRHGASADLANAMMTVQSDSIRILTKDEIKIFGLDESNSAQADLERIKLIRKCGWDFVERKESFSRAFNNCPADSKIDIQELINCGIKLRKSYGFPDPRCPDDGPLSQYE